MSQAVFKRADRVAERIKVELMELLVRGVERCAFWSTRSCVLLLARLNRSAPRRSRVPSVIRMG